MFIGPKVWKKQNFWGQDADVQNKRHRFKETAKCVQKSHLEWVLRQTQMSWDSCSVSFTYLSCHSASATGPSASLSPSFCLRRSPVWLSSRSASWTGDGDYPYWKKREKEKSFPPQPAGAANQGELIIAVIQGWQSTEPCCQEVTDAEKCGGRTDGVGGREVDGGGVRWEGGQGGSGVGFHPGF